METAELFGKIEGLLKDQVKIHNAAIDEQKQFGKASSEKLEALDKRTIKLEEYTNAYNDLSKATEELKTKSAEMEARMIDLARFGSKEQQEEFKTLGERFVESPQFKEMKENKWEVSRKFEVGTLLEVKDFLTPQTVDRLITVPQRLAGITNLPNVPLTVRAILPVGRTSNNNIEYVRENTFTNNAASQYSPASPTNVYDGALKPKSSISWTLINTPVRTIAHWMKASRQILDDAPMLQSEINNRLLYGLAVEEERQLLLGDGTNGNLLGLVPQSTAYNTGLNVAGDTKIDKIAHALLQVMLNKYLPTAVVLAPKDWHDIMLIKTEEGGANKGSYVFSNPAAATEPRIWGYRVIPAMSLTAGDFVVGNFATGAQIFDRMTSTVEVARQNEDDFVRNMVSILAEERIAFAVYSTGAFVEGTF